MEEVILFIMSYIFIFIVYQLLIIHPAKKSKAKKRKDPIEVKYLIAKYKLDIKKINYDQLLQIVAIVSSLDIALVGSIIVLADNFLLEIFLGIISIVVLIIGSYHLVYLFYKKKGMIKND